VRTKAAQLELDIALQRYNDWLAGKPVVYPLDWYIESNKSYRSRRHYCKLALDVLDELDNIPNSKWLGPEPPAYHFHKDEFIASVYSMFANMNVSSYFEDPVHVQDIIYAWGYEPSNKQEDRMKAITKFFNDPSSKGMIYFFFLSDNLKLKVKAASAKYDTWWMQCLN